MSDSIAGSYATLAGTEIVNDSRTFAYLNAGIKPSSLQVNGDCGCENIRELVGHDGPYTTPEGDNAPWFDPNIPESARFAGFLTTNFEGMGSTFTRPVADRIGNGGVLGRGRLAQRVLNWRGFLLGSDGCGVAYGLRWLSKTLFAGGGCQDCNGDDLELLVCCPASTGTDVEAFRLLKNVALVEGPLVLSERKTECGCGIEGCTSSNIVEIEFTLTSAQPYLYEAPIPVFDCVQIQANSIPSIVGIDEEPCAGSDCGEAVTNTFCPPPPLPPASTFDNACFFDSTDPTCSLYLSVPRNTWSTLEEVVPVITIDTGTNFVQELWIRFYFSANDNPCGDLITNPPNCDPSCDLLRIFAIPDNSTFNIDGRTRKMSLICSPTAIVPGEPFTKGPWSWPTFRDFGFCMEVLFYCGPTDPPLSTACVSLSLVPRTF